MAVSRLVGESEGEMKEARGGRPAFLPLGKNKEKREHE
jgi:hypothetical protein